MKTYHCIFILAATLSAAPLFAQVNPRPARTPARGSQAAVNSTGNYSNDIVVVSDAQQQALDQARQMLEQGENAALSTAVKQMELAQSALAAAKDSPDKLPAAIAAEQAAYQALLKATPREYRVQRQRSQSQGQQSGQQSGQPNQQQLNQLDLANEQNRYETERQATTPQNAQQREQTQVQDRLKELSQRQQDLNDRMRELQTALQAAKTDQEREDIQRQLKRLADEQRQQLANVDQLRQQLAQSPNADAQADAQKQLDQARQDMQRASEELQNQSASSALAAGTRAQQNMQNLREDLRRQTSSQFSDQMREMRNEARDLAKQQEDITSKLDALNNDTHQSLDDSAPRKELVQQMAQQQSTLTNLLAQMRDVTEQAETTEPLLSKQLYDTLRRADQMHTDNLLDMGSQLTERGFLPQASQAERAARTNITEIASSVERAADSVLGSEADALRYAQKQLDDLTRQVEREINGGTNSSALAAGGNGGAQNQSNRVSRAAGNPSGEQGTNGIAGANGRTPGNESQTAGNNPQSQQRGEGNQPGAGQNGNRGQQPGQQPNGQGNGQAGQGQANNGQRGGRGQQPNGQGNNGEQASADGQQNGQGEQGQAAAGNNGQRGNGQRGNRGGDQQQANNDSQQPGEQGQPQGGQQQGGQRGGGQQAANGGGNTGGGGDRLRQFTQQLGRGGQTANNGPITGNGFVNWSDQLRDVETVLDPADLRNQLATVRERVAAYRAGFRDRGEKPSEATVRQEILVPLTQVRVWLAEEAARKENASSLVPLDRDPVPETYSDLVRTYYEKLGSAK